MGFLGFVRAIRLKTKQGEYSRPITKLGLRSPSNEDKNALNDEPILSSQEESGNQIERSKNINKTRLPTIRLTRLSEKAIKEARN